MKPNPQTPFIQTVRQALGKPIEGDPAPDLFDIAPDNLDERLARIQRRDATRRQELLDELATRTHAVNTGFTVVADTAAAASAVRDLVLNSSPEWGSEKQVVAWDHPLINELDLAGRLAADGVPVTPTKPDPGQPEADERDRLRRSVEAAYLGVTSADFVVAHTATMVMKSRPAQLRSVSLVPSIHVCVVTADRLVADLEELYLILQWDPGQKSEGLSNCMTFISAPSKTGDIELVMVNGAHGPREVHLIVINN